MSKNVLIITALAISIATFATVIIVNAPIPSKETTRYKNVEIRTIDGCEYVFWHNGYGSNMEHHGNCKQCKDN